MTEKALALANRVSEDLVRAEPEPDFTATWRPYSHGKVLDAMAIAVKDAGLKISNKEYSLSPGRAMAAAWEIESSEKDFNFGISILNAINKSHAVTLGVFEKIFVCSNFCFRMAWHRVMFRKHSGTLEMGEIVYLASESLKLLIPKFENLKNWHQEMKQSTLSVGQTALLTVAAMRRRVIPIARYDAFNDMLFSPQSKYREYAGSMYAWHGAATELMNDNSILTIMSKQDELNYFIDYEAPIVLQRGAEKTIDMDAVRSEGWKNYQTDREKKQWEDRENFKMIRQNFLDLKKKQND